LQITGFAAIEAIIRTVGAESHIVETLAKNAVLLTGAAFFLLIALRADEFFRHHTDCILSRLPEGREKRIGTKVAL